MPGSALPSLGCTATARPPRLRPASGRASAGGATGSETGPSICESVAIVTRTGTAAATSCVTFRLSFARAPPCSSALPVQVMLKLSAGTCTGQLSSFAPPAGTVTSCGASASGAVVNSGPLPTAVRTAPCRLARTVMSFAVVLRRVSIAASWSPSRTSGGRPDSSCRSCVTRTVALPLPNFCGPASATATRRKLVSESLSGTSTSASPLASSTRFGCHSSRVSNSSRAPPRPPPPPAATALRP